MTAEKIKEKYAQLERDLGSNKILTTDYNEIKRLVMATDALVPTADTPKYYVLAEALEVSKNGRVEMSRLYDSVITPINIEVIKMKMNYVGTYNGDKPLVLDIEDNKHNEKLPADKAVSEFVDKFTDILKVEGLDKSTNIKAIILYPLIMGYIDTWKRHNPSFADMAISALESSEEDAQLKAIIECLNAPVSRIGIRKIEA